MSVSFPSVSVFFGFKNPYFCTVLHAHSEESSFTQKHPNKIQDFLEIPEFKDPKTKDEKLLKCIIGIFRLILPEVRRTAFNQGLLGEYKWAGICAEQLQAFPKGFYLDTSV